MIRHPAKFSDSILDIINTNVDLYSLRNKKILDPFGGVGKIKNILPDTVCIDIEYEWAKEAGGVQANSLDLPFSHDTFDGVITSPSYANRMADHFECKDGGRGRITYRHYLGKPLHKSNTGRMQWGNDYRGIHTFIYIECWRVMKSNAIIIVNVSNHIRNGKEIDVCKFHKETISGIGFEFLHEEHVETPRMRYGANNKVRANNEVIYVMKKVPTTKTTHTMVGGMEKDKQRLLGG